MGIGHRNNKHSSRHHHYDRYDDGRRELKSGGLYRNKRRGRLARILSTKEPLHVVFKINGRALSRPSLREAKKFLLITLLLKKYARRFSVKIEQLCINHDHIHILIHATKRTQYQAFFRVTTGQIAQKFKNQGLCKVATTPLKSSTRSKVTDTPQPKKLWMYRPFTRIVRGYGALRRVKNYIQLNEKEARGDIPYRKERSKGLSTGEWALLWE